MRTLQAAEAALDDNQRLVEANRPSTLRRTVSGPSPPSTGWAPDGVQAARNQARHKLPPPENRPEGGAFPVIMDRFAYCVRSATIPMRERELAIVSICRNIGTWRPLRNKDQLAFQRMKAAVHHHPIGAVPARPDRFPHPMWRGYTPAGRPNGMWWACRGSSKCR